jgi:eukaryotic-like serine/threonine-protein kinase
MASSEPRRALGRYVLEEPIATGTTATIWRARDSRTQATVAVKLFQPHLVADEVARRRMEKEADAARRVHAPTIVSAIDRVSRRGEFALVFPYVSGTSLADRLRETTLTPEQAAAVAADIADALVAIHRAGLVHREVKPGNVLLADDGRARLLDFGISHTLTDDIELDQALTGAGLAIGTLPYMAPEQLSAQSITRATDVYGLGVVLYEMLARRRPFEAMTPVALAAEQRVQPARIADAPEPLVELALRALSVDPAARPTAADMSASLRNWLTSPVVVDAPTAPVAAVAAAPSARPQRKGLVTGAIAIAGFLVLAVVALAAMSPSAVLPSAPASSAPAVAAVTTPTPAPSPAESTAPATPAGTSDETPATRQSKPGPSSTPTPAPKPPPAPKAKSGGHHGHGHHHKKKPHHKKH